MFEKFQQLTPLQRSLIVLLPLAIVVALVILLVNTSGQEETAPAPQDSSSASPTPSYEAPSDTPTSVAPYALNTPPAGSRSGEDTPDTTSKYTNAQKAAASSAAYRAMVAYCRYIPGESAEAHLARLKPFYAPENFDLGAGDIIGVIKSQQCVSYTNAELTGLTDDGALTYGVAMQQATVFEAGAPIVGEQTDSGKDIAYSKSVTMQASMKLVKGKWLAESITSSGD
jgi:hypothetical protein